MSKVYVVDDDAVRRAHICHLLVNQKIHPEPFESIDEFLQFMPSQGFVLIHDHGAQVLTLIEGLERQTWLPVIVYSDEPQTSRIVGAMQAGVASYLSYPLQPDDFLCEYEKLERAFTAKFAKQQRAVSARKMLGTLSNREREILACMLDHGTSKAIARHLGISPRTVEAHRANLMARLDVRTAAQAIRIAVEGDAFSLAGEGALTSNNATFGMACTDKYEAGDQEAADNRAAA